MSQLSTHKKAKSTQLYRKHNIRLEMKTQFNRYQLAQLYSKIRSNSLISNNQITILLTMFPLQVNSYIPNSNKYILKHLMNNKSFQFLSPSSNMQFRKSAQKMNHQLKAKTLRKKKYHQKINRISKYCKKYNWSVHQKMLFFQLKQLLLIKQLQ